MKKIYLLILCTASALLGAKAQKPDAAIEKSFAALKVALLKKADLACQFDSLTKDLVPPVSYVEITEAASDLKKHLNRQREIDDVYLDLIGNIHGILSLSLNWRKQDLIKADVITPAIQSYLTALADIDKRILVLKNTFNATCKAKGKPKLNFYIEPDKSNELKINFDRYLAQLSFGNFSAVGETPDGGNDSYTALPKIGHR